MIIRDRSKKIELEQGKIILLNEINFYGDHLQVRMGNLSNGENTLEVAMVFGDFEQFHFLNDPSITINKFISAITVIINCEKTSEGFIIEDDGTDDKKEIMGL